MLFSVLLAPSYSVALDSQARPEGKCESRREADQVAKHIAADAGTDRPIVRVMPFRLWQLKQNVKAYPQTGKVLVSIIDGSPVLNSSDDLGTSVLLTWMAIYSGLPVPFVIDFFYIGLVGNRQ